MSSATTKAAMKETKSERDAREKEEREGTPPPAILPVGAGQLEKALPATRLLEKRRLMRIVHNELERQKIDFKVKLEVLQKREDALRDKDLHLQESLIGFSRFLQENAIKKKRAEKKTIDEIRIRLEKEQEIIQVELALNMLKEQRGMILAQLDKLMIYQKYLDAVIEKATQFHDINDIMLRHATLVASHNELKQHVRECEDEIEVLRQQLQVYLKKCANSILTINNDISTTKQITQRKKLQTAQLQLNIDSALQTTAAKTLARSQVCMAAENLFFRIDKRSIIARPLQDDPIKNMDMVADFITDLAYITKAYKGFLTKRETPTPKGG